MPRPTSSQKLRVWAFFPGSNLLRDHFCVLVWQYGTIPFSRVYFGQRLFGRGFHTFTDIFMEPLGCEDTSAPAIIAAAVRLGRVVALQTSNGQVPQWHHHRRCAAPTCRQKPGPTIRHNHTHSMCSPPVRDRNRSPDHLCRHPVQPATHSLVSG